jgi:cytochrome d ubiquinol oxidase subunit I
MSFIVHIPLVCFGIAFPALILFVEWRYLRTGDVLFRTLARRWTRVLVTLFAAGVVTGTILSFEMGALWPNFTATFGSVYGLGFAVEGFSFFTEAIFIGIYVYGWDRLSPRINFLSGIPIALSGILGSFMVISVNGWMNHPQGFTLVDGRVRNVHPTSALFGNTYFWHELVHMYFAGYMVTGFILATAYAICRLRGRWGRYERIALAVPLTAAAVAAPLQILIGDWNAREVAAHQPSKLAAMEGLGHTTKGASIHVLGWFTDGRVEYGIGIPRLLSLLAFHNPDATVIGLNAFGPNGVPPINLERYAFQTMVGIGSLLALLSVVFLFVRWRYRRLPRTPWFYRALVPAGPLAFVALIAGWVTTEVGRQPWVVYRVMHTSDAVTGASGIPVGFAVFGAAYLLLACIVGFTLWRLAAVPVAATE